MADSDDRYMTNFGLYSRAAEAARGLPQDKGSPQQMLAMLAKQKGVKAEELRLANPEEAFAGQKSVTREELANHFENSLPILSDENRKKWAQYSVEPPNAKAQRKNYREVNVTLNDKRYSPENPYQNRLHYADVYNPLVRLRMQDRDESAANKHRAVAPPKADTTLRLSSGREVPAWSTTAPGLKINLEPLSEDDLRYNPKKKPDWVLAHEGSGLRIMSGKSFWAVDKAAKGLANHLDWTQDKDDIVKQTQQPEFKEKNDERKVWANLINLGNHVDPQIHAPDEEQMRRFKKRGPRKVEADGRKHLLIDELQSDWGQEGRQRGFSDPNTTPSGRNLPHAPYVTKTDAWVDLGLKRALMEAAKGDYDTLVWTPGEVQAKRYPEAALVANEFRYWPKLKKFIAWKGFRKIHEQDNFSPEKIATLIGKEKRDQLLASPLQDENNPHHMITTEDTRIAPREAGMKAFYEGQIPKRLKEILAEHEPNLQFTTLQSKDSKVNGFPALVLTPELREKIRKRGFPAFDEGGIVRMANGGVMKGNVMPSLAQMRMALMPKDLQSIGAQEAPDMNPKMYFPPDRQGTLPPGGAATPSGMPIGGVDMSRLQGGQQLMPQPPQQPMQPPMQQPPMDQGGLPAPPQQPQGGSPANILSLTPQGQIMNALTPRGGAPQQAASGGSIKYPTINPTILANQDDGVGLQSVSWMSGGNVDKMAGGGDVKFSIQPPKATAKTPENFTPYNDKKPSIKTLATAFNEAIAHHLSLSPEQRIANSQRAAAAVAEHIGRTNTGKPKDLLGKNAKLIKSEKGEEQAIKLPDGRGVETTGLALPPAYEEEQFQTCPNHAACKLECLGKTSGNYFKLGGGTDLEAFKGPRLNSLRKTQAFLRDPHSFAVKLYDEIQAAKDMAAANGNHLGVRLNVLSDISPLVHESIIKGHPDVTFYDYTKNKSNPIASNHHYTYSSTGVTQPGVENPNTNWKRMRQRLDNGDNVAMAFSHKEHLPHEVHDQETGKVYRVVDGDTHDFRPLDMQPEGEPGVIIGLKNKKATGKVHEVHKDSNGFFVHYDPQLQMNPNGTYKRSPVPRVTKEGKPKIGETLPQNRRVNIIPQEKVAPAFDNDGERQ